MTAAVLVTAPCSAIWVTSGTPIPPGPRGVDTSEFNHGDGDEPIDWDRVATRNAFVFMKATQGTQYEDPWFAEDLAGASRTSLYRAPYHFFDSQSPGDAEAQAAHFVRTARAAGYTGRNPGELPPVLDAESGWRHHRPSCPPGTDARQLATFLGAVEEAFGIKPIVYTEYSFAVSCLAGNAAVFRGHLQWLASWGAKPRPLPGTDQPWTFWQYTDQAQVPGISDDVDRSVYRGTLTELRALAGVTGFARPEAAPRRLGEPLRPVPVRDPAVGRALPKRSTGTASPKGRRAATGNRV
ncbi:glycosyl hydrolase [Streptomyces pacificus]|uniref:Glycosyl hydrolase n=1 Tax=Streptomyces pacificus TaxID=2705029 RepID=A0A6A0ANG3_9ACTN|nr:glycosyl hydrolase [Streptomyces pacificus]